jgi:hypothetical protein
VTPHVLRHTSATTALQKGISLAAIQNILGHDQLTKTAICLNLTDTHLRDYRTLKQVAFHWRTADCRKPSILNPLRRSSVRELLSHPDNDPTQKMSDLGKAAPALLSADRMRIFSIDTAPPPSFGKKPLRGYVVEEQILGPGLRL